VKQRSGGRSRCAERKRDSATGQSLNRGTNRQQADADASREVGLADRDYMKRDPREYERGNASFGSNVSANGAAWIVGIFVATIALSALGRWLGFLT